MATLVKETYPVLGLTCSSCSEAAERNLKNNPGVVEAKVFFSTNSAELKYDPAVVQLTSLQAGLRKLGYELVASGDDKQAIANSFQNDLLRKLWVAAALALPAFVLEMWFSHLSFIGPVVLALSAVVVVYAGGLFFRSAWQQARQGSMSMDTLVALGVGAALVVSILQVLVPEWLPGDLHLHSESAAIIVLFILFGRYLEETAKARTDDDLRDLLSIEQQTVSIHRDGTPMQVLARDLQIGDLMDVPEGARIPADGMIHAGTSYVDESMLTGEPVPVPKQVKDTVTSGTVVTGAGLVVQATQVGVASSLAKLISEIQRAQASKGPAQQLADRLAYFFVPAVSILALGTLVSWWLWGGAEGLSIGLVTALTVLIVSCPCALGLAAPVAIKLAIGRAAKMGFLVKDATALDAAARIDTLLLDKTGTLTVGSPSVTDLTVDPERVGRAGEFLPAGHALADFSTHPLSKSIARYFRRTSLNQLPVERIEELSGLGLRGLLGDEAVLLGNERLLQEAGVAFSQHLLVEGKNLAAAAKTQVWLAFAGNAVAVFGICDPIKPDAAGAIAALRASGLHVQMLTGDNPQTAQAVARQTGITDFKASLTPADKKQAVLDLQAKGHKVAVVGDGLNDAVALTHANLSIAMGSGTEVARYSAQVIALGSKLGSLGELLHLSRFTRRIVAQNLAWAFAYNLVALPLAMGLFYPILMWPMLGGLAMAGSSFAVVLNSLRIKGFKTK